MRLGCRPEYLDLTYGDASQPKFQSALSQQFVAELYGDVKYSKDGTLVIDRKKK